MLFLFYSIKAFIAFYRSLYCIQLKLYIAFN